MAEGVLPLFVNWRTGEPLPVYPYTDVRIFGAVGDGVVDDTAAFNRAFIAAAGKTLFVPDGSYLISSTITIPADTDVILSRNATIIAGASMTTMFETDADDIHSNRSFSGGLLDCNSLAISGLWLKSFNKYSVEDTEILDHVGPNGAIRLGRTAGPSSYEAFIFDVRINRLDGAAPTNSKGIEFEHAGDCHISDTVIVGQQYGVYGSYADSKLTRVHCWNYGPTHGSLVVGFHALGPDAIHVQCQVDGPVSSNCYYAGSQRLIYVGCATNNPSLADGGTDQTAGCVFVETGGSAKIAFCSFKGSADARWSFDIGGAGDIDAWRNFAVNTSTEYGDTPLTPTTIASGTASGATIEITDIPPHYSSLMLQINGASSDTATRHLQVQISTDNGSTWDTTASNYVGYTVDTAGVLAAINEASLVQTADVAAANAHTIGIILHGYANNGHMTAIGRISNGTTNYSIQCTNCKNAPVDAIKVLWNGTGNFDAGTYILEGVN